MNKPLVTNAADEVEIKEAGLKANFRKEKDADDLKYILQSFQGRRLLWRILGHCHTHGSVFNTNALVQSYNSGKQDVGHFVMGEIIKADEDAYLKMMKESKENKL